MVNQPADKTICLEEHRDEAISVPRAMELGSRFSFALYFVTSLASSLAVGLIASGNGEPPDER
jgi:hypothetical protein